MSKVLVVSTGRKTRGGITSVIKAHEVGEQWKKYHCHWVQTHRDGPTWRKVLYLFAAWIDYICRIQFYDIVHIHFSSRNSAKRKLFFAITAKLLKKKLIVHLHFGSRLMEMWNKDYEKIFSLADVGLFLSESLKNQVEELTCSANDLRVLYNPCPKSITFSTIVRQQHILFSGILSANKGYKDVLRAFSIISHRHPEWRLIFAGNGEIDSGKLLAKKLKIREKVDFLGWVTGAHKNRIFQEASIFCLASRAEGFPMAVLDAWAYGLPVITTPVGGIPDVAKDGENMLLFEPGDVDGLAVQLEKMISDEALREHISKASLHFAQHEFNLDTINKQLGELYEELSQN